MLLRLEWRDRSIAHELQTSRRFLDFVVDGDSLYERFGPENISCLGWFSADEDECAARRLVGEDPPNVDGRIAIYVCAECGDVECGAVTARLDRSVPGEVMWSDLALSERDHDQGVFVHDLERFAGLPPLRFSADAYTTTIASRPRPPHDS